MEWSHHTIRGGGRVPGPGRAVPGGARALPSAVGRALAPAVGRAVPAMKRASKPGRRRWLGRLLLLSLAVAMPGGAQQGGPETLLQQGAELAAAGRLAEAEVPLARAAEQAPADSRVLTLLAQVKGRLGEAAEAAGLLRRVVDLDPHSAAAHLNLGIALADSGQAQAALDQVEQAIRLEPGNAQAHLNRARMLADANRPPEARSEFAQAARLAPHDANVALFQATFEKDQQRPQAAVALLTRVVRQQPNNAAAYLLLGQSYQAVHQQEQAIAAWRRVIAIDPHSEEALYALAQALRQRKPTEAAQYMERFDLLHTQRQQTDQARALGNQAYAAMQQQQWAAAVAALEQALTVCGQCPLKAGLHERLGLAACHSGDLDRGEQELRLALSLDPEDRTAVDALQWIARQRGAPSQ